MIFKPWAEAMTGERRVTRRLFAFHTWVTHRSPFIILGFLVFTSLLRSGVAMWNWFDLSPQLISSWDSPSNPFQSNLAFNALGTLWNFAFGMPTDAPWMITQLVLAVATVSLIAWLVYRQTHSSSQYLAVALVLASGISTVLWREVGRYDFIFLLCVVVFLLVRSRALVAGALILASVSAPEQALLSGIYLVLLTSVPAFRAWQRRALAFAFIAAGALIAVQIWFTVSGSPYSTRAGLTFRHFTGGEIPSPGRFDTSQGPFATVFQKIYEGLSGGYLLLWSYLGSVLLVFVYMLLTQKRARYVWVLLLSVIALPLFTTLFFGEDPTRDLVISGAPLIVLLAVVGSRRISRYLANLPCGAGPWLTWLAIAMTVLPTVYIFVGPENPYDFIVHMLISWNNGTEIDWTGGAR